MGAPYDYYQINQATAIKSPSTVHCRNTALVWYFQRYFLQRLLSKYRLEGYPDSWRRDGKDYMMYSIFIMGRVAIVNTRSFGVIPQWPQLTGYNVFYGPRVALIANPLFRSSIEAVIDEQCALVKMAPDYMGAWDLITYYADLSALAAEAAGINFVNSKLAYVFGAENKTQAEALKKMFDQIQAGNPAAFIDKDLFNDDGTPAWLYFSQNLQQNYIAGEILQDIQQIEAAFNTAIGIPNVGVAKKSGVTVDEVNANNAQTKALCELWRDSIKDGLNRANEMFGLNLRITLQLTGEEELGNGNTIDPRTVSL